MTHLFDLSHARTPDERLGVAALTRAAYAGADLGPVADGLRHALRADPTNATALMDLSVIEQIYGNLEQGLTLQALALHRAQSFTTASPGRKTLRLLVLAAPLHMGGNTPVEFLVEGSPIRLETLYIAPGIPLPDPLPAHDIAFVAAPGDSDASRVFLTEINRHLADWPQPVLNAPENIMALERDRSGAVLADVPGLTLPRTARCSRETLAAIGAGAGVVDVQTVLTEARFPVVVRPVGAHAGRNLEKLNNAAEIGAYLETCTDPEFFLSDFVDYRSADGAYRKYRIIFVDGRPYPCHMAIADQWKVWYMNADMTASTDKRAEEERFMTRFVEGFAARHRGALSGMARAFGLDYFGIDCAEDRDGNLVLFEADNALIVHDMDPEDIFPYKAPQMRRIFAGFAAMIARRGAAGHGEQRKRIAL